MNDPRFPGGHLVPPIFPAAVYPYPDLESLDRAMAGLKQIRVFLRDEAPLASVQKHLAGKGEGEVSLILLLEAGQREVELRLPGRYAVTPQIASALRAVRGVVQVEMV
jgi:DNA polymerase-3 subunit alpha